MIVLYVVMLLYVDVICRDRMNYGGGRSILPRDLFLPQPKLNPIDTTTATVPASNQLGRDKTAFISFLPGRKAFHMRFSGIDRRKPPAGIITRCLY